MKTYGAASAKKHETVRKLGAIPIDYRAGRLDRLVRELEPRGVDCAFDAVGGANIGLCIRATRRGGTVVGYGFMGVKGTVATLAMFANLLVGARVRGRRGKFYGITMLYRKDPKPLREDLPKIFALIAEKKLDPLVGAALPLVEAGRGDGDAEHGECGGEDCADRGLTVYSLLARSDPRYRRLSAGRPSKNVPAPALEAGRSQRTLSQLDVSVSRGPRCRRALGVRSGLSLVPR